MGKVTKVQICCWKRQSIRHGSSWKTHCSPPLYVVPVLDSDAPGHSEWFIMIPKSWFTATKTLFLISFTYLSHSVTLVCFGSHSFVAPRTHRAEGKTKGSTHVNYVANSVKECQGLKSQSPLLWTRKTNGRAIWGALAHKIAARKTEAETGVKYAKGSMK